MRTRNTMRKKAAPIKFEIELICLDDDKIPRAKAKANDDSVGSASICKPKKLKQDDDADDECVAVESKSTTPHVKDQRKNAGKKLRKGWKRNKHKDTAVCIPIGAKVSAKYKGAFCQAKISCVRKEIRYRVTFDGGIGARTISDELIDTTESTGLYKGSRIKALHPDQFAAFPKKKPPNPNDYLGGVIDQVKDQSTYTVVFDDGDTITMKRNALRFMSEKIKPKSRYIKDENFYKEDDIDKSQSLKRDSSATKDAFKAFLTDTSKSRKSKPEARKKKTNKKARTRLSKWRDEKSPVDFVALNIALSLQKDKSVKDLFSNESELDISSFLDVCIE